jgi:hypothetical protein
MYKCRFCGEEVILIKTARGKKILCDPKLRAYLSGGSDHLITDDGRQITCTIIAATARYYDGFAYMPHWATCKGVN